MSDPERRSNSKSPTKRNDIDSTSEQQHESDGQQRESNASDSINQSRPHDDNAKQEAQPMQSADQSPPQNEQPNTQANKTKSRPSATSNASTMKRTSSQLYVIHGERGGTFVNRTCHLPRSEGVNVKARRKLIIASALCLFFMVCQIIGGILSNSLAIAADAAHTLTDFAGFMISLFAIFLAGRKATDRLSFGWYRAEVIGALASVMTIWFITAILVWLAIQRCINQDFEIHGSIMMITAVFGIVINVILGLTLMYGSSDKEVTCDKNHTNSRGKTHSHSGHGHSHLCDKFIMKLCNICSKPKEAATANGNATAISNCPHQQGNINVRAAYLHVIGDAVQSVGVLVAAIVIYFRPDWAIADPICTFIFSVIVLYTTLKLMKDIILVLMEGTPTYMEYDEVQEVFENIEGVISVHGLRIWALSLDKVALAVHLVIEPGGDAERILRRAEHAVHTRYHLFETTIQIEEDHGQHASLENENKGFS